MPAQEYMWLWTSKSASGGWQSDNRHRVSTISNQTIPNKIWAVPMAGYFSKQFRSCGQGSACGFKAVDSIALISASRNGPRRLMLVEHFHVSLFGAPSSSSAAPMAPCSYSIATYCIA